MRKVPSITGYESPSELLGAQTYDTALYVLLHFFFCIFSREFFMICENYEKRYLRYNEKYGIWN
jgi:hypothetical protein